MTISKEAVVFKAGKVTGRLTSPSVLRHNGRCITLVKARLGLPWLNTALIITDGKTRVSAGFWGFARSRVRAALDSAGFEVQELPTWFSLGASPRSEVKRPLGAPRPATSNKRTARAAIGLLGMVLAAGSAVALVATGGSVWILAFAGGAIALFLPFLRS